MPAQTATPPAVPPAAPPAPPAAFDWDALLPAVAAPAPSYAAGSQINVLTEIPAPIRKRAEDSLLATVTALRAAEAKGTNVKNLVPPWQLQPVASVEMGEEFRAKLTRYCRYRPEPENGAAGIEFQGFTTNDGQNEYTPNGQLTCRSGEPKEFPVGENGKPVLCVRFVVKPFEAKKDTKAVK